MLTGRRASLVVIMVVCAVVAGCGSSGHSGASQANTSSTPAQTTAPTTTTTAPPQTPQGDVSGRLDRIPEGGPARGTLPSQPSSPSAQSERAYLSAVFNDAQHFWERQFSQAGASYAPAGLRLFANAVHSGCGVQAETGPFYCPANRTIYLDLGFFEALARHAGVGPFGQAYIIGHELGHHVQHLTGIDQQVAALNHHDPAGANARSVRVELQADCLAGVWAHSSQARGQLSDADLTDALKTAALVGDDFQQHAGGHVVDSAMWTHGSSEQRQHWLLTGFRSGSPSSCDTFASHLS